MLGRTRPISAGTQERWNEFYSGVYTLQNVAWWGSILLFRFKITEPIRDTDHDTGQAKTNNLFKCICKAKMLTIKRINS